MPTEPAASHPSLWRERLWARLPARWQTGRRRVALAGASWSLIGQGGTQLLRLVSMLVLARLLLSPEAFGLVALVNVFISGLEMLSDVGLGPNIVQHPRGEEPAFLRTAFTIQIVRGALLWLVATALAYPFAWFYEEPALGPLILVASLATLIRGTASVEIHVLTRRVALRPVTFVTLGAELVGFAFAVSWAVLAPSVWALVAGTVTSAIAYSAGSHFAARLSPRFGWNPAAAREIVKFGGWVFIATATWFLCSQGERLFLGKIATTADLGNFALAASLSTLPLRYVTQFSGQVMYPLVAAALRADRARGLLDFRRMRLMFVPLALAVAAACVVLGQPVVSLLLGPEYADAGWMVQLLGLRVGFDILTVPVSGLILAAGQSQYSAAQNTLRLVALVVGLQLIVASAGLFWGVVWLVAVGWISFVVSLYAVRRLAPALFATELALFAGFSAASLGLSFAFVRV